MIRNRDRGGGAVEQALHDNVTTALAHFNKAVDS